MGISFCRLAWGIFGWLDFCAAVSDLGCCVGIRSRCAFCLFAYIFLSIELWIWLSLVFLFAIDFMFSLSLDAGCSKEWP